MRTARPLYSILAAENLRLQKIDHLAGANRKRIDENRRKIVRGHQMASNYDFLTEGNLINSIIAHQWWWSSASGTENILRGSRRKQKRRLDSP